MKDSIMIKVESKAGSLESAVSVVVAVDDIGAVDTKKLVKIARKLWLDSE